MWILLHNTALMEHLHKGDGAGGGAGAGVPGPGPRHHLPHTGQTSKKRNFQDDKLG